MSLLRTVLVDDSDEIRSLVRMLLKHDGRFDVVGEASDGARAVAVVAQELPDLVVLDIEMPGVSGLEAIPSIRASAPDVRIVMLSGLAATDMAAPAMDLGAVGYIEKQGQPSQLADRLFTLATVLETVQRVLDSTYAAQLTSAREARIDLRAALAAKVGDTAVEIVELLTTELVVNSIEHGGATPRVTAEILPGKVRVAVHDDGQGVPTRRSAATSEESGRGLTVVAALAQRWGVDTTSAGKAVWFEVAI